MKAMCEAHPDTQLLYSKLQELEVGGEVTYQELRACIGRDVQTEARGLLGTAIKWMRVRDGRVIRCVRGVGMKRLSDSETIAAAAGAVKHISRSALREMKRLATPDYEKLSDEDRNRLNMRRTIFSILRTLTTVRAEERVLKAVTETQDRLPFRKSLALFTGKKLAEEAPAGVPGL